MELSPRAAEIYASIKDSTKRGDLRKWAKTIKRDHDLALELWSIGELSPRLLAILVMDNKQLTQDAIDQLTTDLHSHPLDDRNAAADWLMANQLAKSARTVRLLQSWQSSPSALQRRLFWYHQARLRWTGQTPPDNTGELVDAIEAGMAEEEPEVQWAMNFTAGQIGTYQPEYRARCIAVGEQTGLYRDQVVHKGCTPNYLPEFIRIQAEKAGT